MAEFSGVSCAVMAGIDAETLARLVRYRGRYRSLAAFAGAGGISDKAAKIWLAGGGKLGPQPERFKEALAKWDADAARKTVSKTTVDIQSDTESGDLAQRISEGTYQKDTTRETTPATQPGGQPVVGQGGLGMSDLLELEKSLVWMVRAVIKGEADRDDAINSLNAALRKKKGAGSSAGRGLRRKRSG